MSKELPVTRYLIEWNISHYGEECDNEPFPVLCACVNCGSLTAKEAEKVLDLAISSAFPEEPPETARRNCNFAIDTAEAFEERFFFSIEDIEFCHERTMAQYSDWATVINGPTKYRTIDQLLYAAINAADVVRKCRGSISQANKDKAALWAWERGLTWPKVAEHLKTTLGIEIGEDAVKNWAERQWSREHPKDPFPKRKSGRPKKE